MFLLHPLHNILLKNSRAESLSFQVLVKNLSLRCKISLVIKLNKSDDNWLKQLKIESYKQECVSIQPQFLHHLEVLKLNFIESLFSLLVLSLLSYVDIINVS